ncbi:MAG: hypothetical protein RL421_1068 [Actinomycetota bacterium]|jgi:hypothetical protein
MKEATTPEILATSITHADVRVCDSTHEVYGALNLAPIKRNSHMFSTFL